MKNYKLQFVGLILVLFHVDVQAQKSTNEGDMPGIRIISAVDVEEEIDGQPARVSTVELIIQPNQKSQPHRHPGPVYGYILEGTYEFKVEGQPLKTLKPGDTFYEPLMALHEVGSNPSNTSVARILAIVTHPRSAKNLILPK
jgi:quercetin dioxygenase-like cupin family protein